MEHDENNIINWEKWFLVALSLLLVVTFALYLPTWFRGRSTSDSHIDSESNIHEPGEHDGHAAPSSESISSLRKYSPGSVSVPLSFKMVDGVKEFRLEASEFLWEYADGEYVHVWGYNGQVPGPEIRVSEGDNVRVIVKNSLPDATTVHWHGLDTPWQQDGVPNITQSPIKPGEEYVYEFSAIPAGTRFYHTHGNSEITTAQQMDMGLSGPFIVEENVARFDIDKEFTLILDEWNIQEGGINPAVAHVHGAGSDNAVPEYNTFTINGRIFPNIDILKINEGDAVLIRFINTGTTAFHPMHLHGHSFAVVARDGFTVPEGVQERRNTLTIHPGETADVLVYANNPGPWLLHCHHVHHASAGMITLMQYEGYEPVGDVEGTHIEDLDHIHDDSHEHDENVDQEENHMHDDSHEHEEDVNFDGDGHDHEHQSVLRVPWYSSSTWWTRFVVSIVLLIALSFGVNKYLAVK